MVVSAAKAPMNTVPLLVNTVPFSTVDPVGRHHLKGLTQELEPDPAGMKEANPWVSLFEGNRVASNGMSLNYITPELVNGKLVVNLDEKEQEKEEVKWKHSLVLYIIGEMPGYNYMKPFISQTWANVANPDLFYHDEGYYVVKFQSEPDLKEILFAGPYSINNKSMILKQWTPKLDFKSEFLTEIPLWVTFPKLPLNCWGCESLSRIASAIGIPIFVDECTTKQTRISYARMLIEVDVTKPIPTDITVMDACGQSFQQVIVFDWKPEYCEGCMMVGHNCHKDKPKQVGQPRTEQTHPSAKQKQPWMVRKVLGAKDHLHVLHHAIDGKRSKIRQAYNQMLGDYPKVDWRGLICRNLARPKAIFILWLQIQNRLPTTDRLLKWRMPVDSKCVMCKQEDETRDHLFFECALANSLWRRLLQWTTISQPPR
ncbi:hypothetical protein RDI58_012592 [Solanum bulbocastanum]|uniref:Reverse transcriptase zinc-binding domain-containing protein n=1 Tax=Solanum bulbocastanum TaxID=147425 RepID=A0AAN8TL93_SOLBU